MLRPEDARIMALLSKVADVMPDRLFVRTVAWQYRFFEAELRHLHELVPRNRTAIDVGAWWGPWTWWLARQVPAVHAFEPNVEIATVLSRVVPGNVQVHAQAVSDNVGKACLSIPYGGRGTEGRASLLSRQGKLVDVPTVTLDALALSRVGFVKIDVEGHEDAVLRGADRMIGRERPNIVIEVEQQFYGEGSSMNATFELLEGMDYEGRFLWRGRWQSLDCFNVETHQLRNLHQVQKSGLIRNMFLNSRRYVNNFAFFPREAM